LPQRAKAAAAAGQQGSLLLFAKVHVRLKVMGHTMERIESENNTTQIMKSKILVKINKQIKKQQLGTNIWYPSMFEMCKRK
jgi:hypothetical protein